jgi:heterodisulfide reductase subunit B
MKHNYALYEGCSLHSTGREYLESLEAVCRKLKITLQGIKDWTCCGTSSRISSSHLVSVALPLKNLCQAEKDGQAEVLVPCAACFYRLKDAIHQYTEHADMRDDMEKILLYRYGNSVTVLHPLEIFSGKEALTAIQGEIKTPLKGLKAVTYYGCLITRPPEVMQIEHFEYPVMMDRVLQTLGMEVLDWSHKTECCGASHSLTRKDVVLKLCERILDDAKERGADLIAVACPLCQSNLDMRQKEVEEMAKTHYDIPILYFTQLMGLAFGIDAKKLSLQRHMTSTELVQIKVEKKSRETNRI